MNHKSNVKNSSDFEHLGILSTSNIKRNKFPLIITITFFLALSFVSLTYHNVWHEADGISFLNFGQQILDGDGENVKITDANHFSSVDLAKYKKVILTETSVKELEKRYS